MGTLAVAQFNTPSGLATHDGSPNLVASTAIHSSASSSTGRRDHVCPRVHEKPAPRTATPTATAT